MIDAPLTEAQEGLWLARRLDPRNPIQNTGHLLRVRGSVELEQLAGTVRSALAECDAFAVRVEERSEGPWLTAEGAAEPTLECVDLGDHRDPERAMRALVHADMARPRDPAADAMASAVVYRLGPGHCVWYQCVQHLVIDGYGTTLLNTRVVDLLRARVTGEEPRTRPFASFQRVLEEDRRYRASERRAADLDFWTRSLAGMPSARSFSDGEPITAHFHHRARATIPAEVRAALADAAGAVKASWPDAVAAMLAAFVRRHVGGDEVVLGVPAMNRLGSASARVPCMVMNVLPVRLGLDERRPAADVIAEVREVLTEARRHGRYRSEQLRRDLGFMGEGRRLFGPLVNVLPFQPLPDVPGTELELEILGAGPVDDITFTFRGGGVGGEVALEVDANPELHSLSETEAYRDRLLAFLAGADGSAALVDLPTLTPAEHVRWVEEVNDTARDVEDVTLVELFARACGEHPERAAVSSPTGELTYTDLDRRTAAVAAGLRERGVGPGDVVAVLAPRSAEQVVAFLSAMRAGGAYLPLDPEHPAARIRQILETARPTVVLATPELRDRLPDDVPLAPWLPGAERGGSLARHVEPGDPAYVIFTSGSTGTPKGVVIEHTAIVNRLLWMRARFGFGPEDRVLHKTPATFDVSVWELFLPFVCGGTLVVAPPEAHRDPGGLARLVREREVTAMHFVPSMLGPFLDHPDSAGLMVARVFCSGEALPAHLRDRFHGRIRGELHNLYGPTEAAVDVTHWPAPASDDSDPVPIGRPVWNTRTYVLDPAGHPVPPGVVGELYLAGRQLARGYLRRPHLTAEAFVADPFGGDGARMYRTGDLARWRVDGALVFEGRIDHQIKLRGQRVELGEIGSVLGSVVGVGDAVAVLREDRPGDPAIVAYVTAAGDADLDGDELREATARFLPEVMVPSSVVVLDALPVTANGKLDRDALPAPDAPAVGAGPPPATATERLVAELFAEALGLGSAVDAGADFFDLGGHSLLAIELLTAVRERAGVDLGPGTLFAHPTVARLAARIDELGRPEAGRDAAAGAGAAEVAGIDPVIALAPPPPGTEKPALYCIHPAGGLSWCYRTLARSLVPARRVLGLQARGLDLAEALPESLDGLAAEYVDLVLERHRDGPVHLLGWSVGGIIAHAMALRIVEAGHTLGAVALLDAYPADRWRDEPDIEEGDALRALLLIAGDDPEALDGDELTRDAVRDRLREGGHALGALPEATLDGIVRVVDANNRLVREHRHRPLDHAVLHFRAGLDHEGMDLDASMWSPYAARIEAHVLPTLHAHMIGPVGSERIATILARHMGAARP